VKPGYWVEDRFRVMGTTAHLIVGDAPDGLVDWAREEFERLERSWTRFDRDSDLSRLNADPRPEVLVPRRLADAVARAIEAWRATDGRFDPTVLDALEAAGYDRSFELIDGPVPTRAPTGPTPGLHDLELDLEARRIRRPPGLHLDLGGIGKGLGIDLVADGLIDRGARRVCLSVGGDVRVAGEAPTAGWSVPVLDPFDAELTWFVAHFTGPGAIVTSSTRFRRWATTEGASAHHLIDPRTGAPSTSGISAVVTQADEAWFAEVVAKAALVAGVDDGTRLLARHHVRAWLALDDRRLLDLADLHPDPATAPPGSSPEAHRSTQPA
jgi:thiamine biosynthesis lipoprotein